MSETHVYRDAVTGEYVTAEYAAENPDTTVRETVAEPPVDSGPPVDAAGGPVGSEQ